MMDSLHFFRIAVNTPFLCAPLAYHLHCVSLLLKMFVPQQRTTCALRLQVDLCAEEMGNNVSPAVALLGDINAIVIQVT